MNIISTLPDEILNSFLYCVLRKILLLHMSKSSRNHSVPGRKNIKNFSTFSEYINQSN